MIKKFLLSIILILSLCSLDYSIVNASTTVNVSNERNQIITKAGIMVDMKWKPTSTLVGWSGKNNFKSNTTYTGMPYSQTGNQVSKSGFIHYLNNSSSLNFYNPYIAPTKITMSRYGNDCSGFLSDAWGIDRQSTVDFISGIKNGIYSKVGFYSSTSPKYSDLKASYTYLQPGDAVVKKGHTYLIVSNDIANKKVYVYEQTPPKAKKASYSYDSMAKSGYMPFTKKNISTSYNSVFNLGTYTYKINSDKNSVTLINGSSNNSKITIPSSIKYNNKTYKVTTIGPHAFSETGAENILKSITIPKGVTTISSYAFANCKNLQYVYISETVKEIGTGSFAGCISINNFSISKSNTNFITKENIIYSTNQTEIISAPSVSGNINISNKVTKIKSGAFYGNINLKKVTLSNSVTSLESYAFADCSNKYFSILLTNKLKSIGEGAFFKSNLTNISLPTSITYIGSKSFAYSNIKEINIPEGVTVIPDEIFMDTPYLTKISLPSTITTISSNAFINCYSINNVNISSKNPNFLAKDNIIYNKNQTTLVKSFNNSSTFTVPSSVTTITDYAFANCTKTKNIIIEGSISKLNPYTFMNCQSLTNITMPNSITEIKHGAFSGCASLKSITLPTKLNIIESRAFAFTGLISLTIPSSVKTIEKDIIYDGYLSTLTFKSSTPPNIKTQIDIVPTVKVPQGKITTYKNALYKNLNYKSIKQY